MMWGTNNASLPLAPFLYISKSAKVSMNMIIINNWNEEF